MAFILSLFSTFRIGQALRVNGFFHDLHSMVTTPVPSALQSTKAKECRWNNACNTARDGRQRHAVETFAK
jgi:hypothetical protein